MAADAPPFGRIVFSNSGSGCQALYDHPVWISLDWPATKHLAVGHSAFEARVDPFADYGALELRARAFGFYPLPARTSAKSHQQKFKSELHPLYRTAGKNVHRLNPKKWHGRRPIPPQR